MFDTFAKIITAVHVGLGSPESNLLEEKDIANVVFRKAALHYEPIRQSDQNLMAKKTSEFTLAAGVNSQDLTSLTSSDIITPLWCEQKIYNSTNPMWRFVPTVNVDTLAERRELGRWAVGFYGDGANQITAEFSIYGDETSSPYNTYRVWYAPANVFTADRDARVAIPNTLTGLIVIDVQISCIALILVNAAKYVDKEPQLVPRVAAWRELKEELKDERGQWAMNFDKWVKRSRGGHRAVNHNEILEFSNWRR